MPSRTRALLVALAVGAALAPGAARAQAASVCTFAVGPTTLAFGPYDPAATAPTYSTGSFQFSCTLGKPKVNATLSTGSSGTYTNRTMVAGANQLLYNLYQDSAYSIVWGDGTGSSQSAPNERQGNTYTIYGRIPAGQWVAPGTYSDTIVLTLNY